MEKRVKCCFTGHRVLARDFDEKCIDETIEALYASGVRVFISGGALGFDMLAGYAVLRAKKVHSDIELWLYLPCRDQDARWREDDKKRREGLIKSADYIHCPDIPYDSTVMKARNYKMVDACDYCVSYFNGKYVSGTAQTIRYAKRTGVALINLGTYDLSNFK
ncbi:MAG: DUF1273 family protein [Clostridia bacterium]|nr:DUF1273 family protein [Clostridia bacterium]